MIFDRALSWADRRNFVSVRSATLGATIWMTWRVTIWAFEYAKLAIAAGVPGTETAAVIAAVTLPFATLQGAAFKIYMGAK